MTPTIEDHWLTGPSDLFTLAHVPILTPDISAIAAPLPPKPVMLQPDGGEWTHYLPGLWLPTPPTASLDEWMTSIITGVLTAYEKAILGYAELSPALYKFFALAKSVAAQSPDDELAELVPALTNRGLSWTCPDLSCDPPYRPDSLSAEIQHLNDQHEWTRESIADWLDSLDVDLTFQAASKGD